MSDRRFYEAPTGQDARRSAPAALRNRDPIAAVIADWLPEAGTVLEVASGTGEHAVWFAERFPGLTWQPSETHPDALASINAWREGANLPNLRAPVVVDASSVEWPLERGDAVLNINMESDSCDPQYSAVLCINMVHISPWSAALGLLDGSAKVLRVGGALILYGPWIQAGVPTAESNLAFDRSLKERNPDWGLRRVEDFQAEAVKRGFVLEQVRAMPANNLMMLLRFKA